MNMIFLPTQFLNLSYIRRIRFDHCAPYGAIIEWASSNSSGGKDTLCLNDDDAFALRIALDKYADDFSRFKLIEGAADDFEIV